MTLSELRMMNKLFWYTLSNEEKERLKQDIANRFHKKPEYDTNKKTFACKQGIGG